VERKMSKELRFREMPQTTAGIGHGIGFPPNVVEQGDISIMALMESLKAKEPRSRAAGRGGPFALPPNGGYAVRGVMDGGFSDIKGLSQYVMLSDTCSELELTVVNVTLRVIEGDQSLLDDRRKGASPQHGLHISIQLGYKMNTAHASSRRILGSQSIRLVFGYYFCNASGPASQICC
jgi:hypothetical protein